MPYVMMSSRVPMAPPQSPWGRYMAPEHARLGALEARPQPAPMLDTMEPARFPWGRYTVPSARGGRHASARFSADDDETDDDGTGLGSFRHLTKGQRKALQRGLLSGSEAAAVDKRNAAKAPGGFGGFIKSVVGNTGFKILGGMRVLDNLAASYFTGGLITPLIKPAEKLLGLQDPYVQTGLLNPRQAALASGLGTSIAGFAGGFSSATGFVGSPKAIANTVGVALGVTGAVTKFLAPRSPAGGAAETGAAVARTIEWVVPTTPFTNPRPVTDPTYQPVVGVGGPSDVGGGAGGGGWDLGHGADYFAPATGTGVQSVATLMDDVLPGSVQMHVGSPWVVGAIVATLLFLGRRAKLRP